MEFKIGDKVKIDVDKCFSSKIGKGRFRDKVGTIININKYGRCVVDIPGFIKDTPYSVFSKDSLIPVKEQQLMLFEL